MAVDQARGPHRVGKASLNLPNVSLFLERARTTEPTAPTAPASVAVNHPKTIPPKMNRGEDKSPSSPSSGDSFAQGIFSVGGPVEDSKALE